MADKIKKTRPELLKQRRSLALFKRFLPTLILKKQQIQMEILKVRAEQKRQHDLMNEAIARIENWVALLGEPVPGAVTRLVKVQDVVIGEQNVAGIKMPYLEKVDYAIQPFSLSVAPPWVDQAVVVIKKLLELREQVKILQQQEKILKQELRKVTQRVNLFEKVMIPQAKENIRIIRISLAEEQTAAVGRSKLAKSKTEAKSAGGHA